MSRRRRLRAEPRATIIERQVSQGAFWRTLFRDSANTIRVLTLWLRDETRPFVARAVQCIGTADTVPVDNWSGGGIAAPIDIGTGRLGVGRRHPSKGPPRGSPSPTGHYSRHPDSGARIEGAILPGWQDITATVLHVALTMPANPLIAWDVLVDDEGVPVIIEANSYPDVDLLQVHGGLLQEPRIRRFCEQYRVIGRS